MNPPDDDPTRDAPEPDFSDEPEDREPAWDAGDERRQRDPMAPPREPCECYCLHCHRVFASDQMWFQKVINSKDGFDGFWMCPTPNCGGAGFTFDIFPTDPDHPANEGWHSFDDDDDEDEDEDEFDDAEYDADEAEYKQLDQSYGADDDEDDGDIEGEEWKHGLQPGEQPPEPKWAAESRQRWEEEQKRYDAPDERPRVVDWSDREDMPRASGEEDEIPF